jgi:tRNA threonylcarbamoyladenosine biosynthesis protein TsaE
MRSWRTRSVAETRRLGERLAAQVAPDGLVLLFGELGSGKTALTQGIARGLGIAPAEVQSPTFTLVREHAGSGGRLVHIDLYRLETDQVADLGLEELLAVPAVKVIEWADRLPSPPRADLALRLARPTDGDTRTIEELATSAARAARPT